MLLKDTGSSNGTRLNGRRLVAGKPEQVDVADSVSFGRASFQIYDAGRLYDLLAQSFPMEGRPSRLSAQQMLGDR